MSATPDLEVDRPDSPELMPRTKGVLVIPCYNEAGRLDRAEFSRYLNRCDLVDFVFVNDGSTDDTVGVLNKLALGFPTRVHVMSLHPNGGKAEAVRQGILAGLKLDPAFIGYWDADLATPLEAISDFCHVLDGKTQYEVLLGSRVRLMGRSIQRHGYRHYLGRVFATGASMSLGLPVYDTQCGAKVFRVTTSTASLFREPFISRWIFDVELLARFVRMSAEKGQDPQSKIYEVTLGSWRDVAGSKVKALDFFRSFRDLLKIRRRYRVRSKLSEREDH